MAACACQAPAHLESVAACVLIFPFKAVLTSRYIWQGILSDSPSNVPLLLHSSDGEDPALTIEQVCPTKILLIRYLCCDRHHSELTTVWSPGMQQLTACVANGAENPHAAFSTMKTLNAMDLKDTARSEVIVVSLGQVMHSPS